MQLRQLGNSTLMVSPIGVGFWGIVGGDYWGAQDETDTIGAVQAALDNGINLFDTAEGYGNGYSEEMLGRALKRPPRRSHHRHQSQRRAIWRRTPSAPPASAASDACDTDVHRPCTRCTGRPAARFHSKTAW